MKVQHFASPLITVLLLSVIGPGVFAAKLNPGQIQFHPTLLNELPSNTSQAAAITAHARIASADTAATTAEQRDAAFHYSQLISTLELQQGLYAAALREPLLALAAEQLQAGNPQAALAGLERAMQITRVQEGLSSLAQVPILHTMINAHVELGDLPNAHNLQQVMLSLQMRHHGHDNVESVPALLEWADWNVNLYLSDKQQDGTSLVDTLEHAGTTVNYANPFIQEAYAHYVSALEILHQQPQAHASLVTIERKLAALNFMVDKDMMELLDRKAANVVGGASDANVDPMAKRVRNFHFSNGGTALERALAYGYLSPEPDHDYIAARMLELADWNLLFDRRVAALELYQKTLDFMAASHLPQQQIDSFFGAGLPVRTPDTAYLEEPGPEQFTGFIDVEVKLSKYGAASDPRLLTEPDADPAVVDELLRTIRHGKFRPVLAPDGVFSDDTVKLRYFYTQL